MEQRAIRWIFLGCLWIFLGSGCGFYQTFLGANVEVPAGEEAWVYVRSSDHFDDFMVHLGASGWIKDTASFRRLVEWSHFEDKIKPGRYKLTDGMTNLGLLKLLGSGRQEPVKLGFHQVRSIQDLAGKVGRKIEADSASIMALLADTAWIRQHFEVSAEQVGVIFIPNTYEMYWATPAESFLLKMKKEYDAFWTEARKGQAEKQGLTPVEVSILASIVQMEQARLSEEWPKIAGLYLNRLRAGMKLQADPTVKFALGDFSLRRLYNGHLQVNSPYNTYLYAGLPPGPIFIPEPGAIDAVLQAEKHNYIFMCAHADLSGRHAFAESYEAHLRLASAYHQALDAAGITE
jgi:UPF0755 protein